MTSHADRIDTHEQEDAAVRLARRMQREDRRRAERRRAVAVTVTAAVAGVLVLIGGLSVASAMRGRPAGGSASVTRTAPVVASAPRAAAAAGAAAQSVTQPAAAEPSTVPSPAPSPAVAARAAAKPKPAPARPTPIKKKTAPAPRPKSTTPAQRFTILIGGSGYEPSHLTASSASRITLTVGKGDGCAAGFTIPSLGINKDNSKSAVTFSLGKLKAGTYRYLCAMQMVEGRLVVR